MGQLTLIRHGQAAAFTEDPDRLTELGHAQARRLGEYLLSRGVAFDRVITGRLRRQRQTAEGVAAVYTAAGKDFPAATVDAGWDEYDAAAVMGSVAPALEAADPAFAELATAAREGLGTSEQNRHFQRMFDVLMDAWASGRAPAEEVETFIDFRLRVLGARDRILASTGGRQVAVFTSGGPIGVNVGASLDAPPAEALRVNSRVRNASLTEFMFSRNRLSFDSFNRLPHLADQPELISFR